LPAVYLNYIIPPNAKAESLIVSQFQFVQIPGEYYIYPAQPPTVIGETVPWVPPDTLVYNSDNSFPGKFIKIVGEGIMDGARIVTVEVCPLQYRPKTKRLFLVKSIGFEFVFGSNNHPELRAKIRGRYEQAVYDAVLRSVVENDNEILAYYQKPTIVEENEIGASGAAPFPVGPSIIIAPQEFHSAFQPYADWLTDQGIKTYLITPQTIYSYFSGVDNAEKMRNYIKYCYENAGGTYFIFGGDDYSTGGISFLPVRYCYSDYSDPPVDSNFHVPCDLYFSDLTGNWNADGDDEWGELNGDEADRYPEVYVGRLTPYCIQEVNNWITKTIGYERVPNLIHTSALWLYAGMQIGDAPYVFPDFFTHYYIEMSNAQEAVENYLSQGYGINNIHCHGVRKYFCNWNGQIRVQAYWENFPTQYDDGLNNLRNFNKYYFTYSLACHNGAYDSHLISNGFYIEPTDTCIVDGFIDTYSSPIGVCAFLGYTRASALSYSYDLEYEFYRKLFTIEEPPPVEPSVTRLGVSEALSKCGNRIDWMNRWDRHNCYAHNLFGSPYTEAWTNQPGNMSVNHPRQIYVGITINLTVSVKDAFTDSPLQYAKVCLNKPQDIYAVGSTDANGQVTFRIKAQSTGTLKVTVTRFHNSSSNYTQYRPSQTTCQVLEPPGGGQSSGSDKLLPTSLCITGLQTVINEKFVLTYGISMQGDVSITIYDATGSKVKSMVCLDLQSGYYEEFMDVRKFSCGVYFLELKQNEKKVSRKLLVVK